MRKSPTAKASAGMRNRVRKRDPKEPNKEHSVMRTVGAEDYSRCSSARRGGGLFYDLFPDCVPPAVPGAAAAAESSEFRCVHDDN